MAEIGMLGDIRFSVSSNQVRTIRSMEWSSSVRWHEHDRHLLPPLLEFGGTSVDRITLTLTFAEVLGIDPMEEMTKLLKRERDGTVMRLIIGTHAYGTYKWVIASSSRQILYYDGIGNVTAAQVTVNLSAYNAR